MSARPEAGPTPPAAMRWVPFQAAQGWTALSPELERGVGPEIPGLARSGHTAVAVRGGSTVVVFGGLAGKKFLGDCVALHPGAAEWAAIPAEHKAWPLPRAFHCAAANASGNMFLFGGRHGRRRLDDFWMLDVDTWQWVELPCTGDQPCARDFATLVAFEGFLILHGGWDGTKFLSDTYLLDTSSLEWRQVPVAGALPPARCGHVAVMVERRMLVLGGRGAGGAMLGDLWALRDFAPASDTQAAAQGQGQGQGQGGGDPPAASWTQLRLPGAAPASRCGHALAAARTQLLVVGGHSQGGFFARVDTYLNDSVVLDRSSVQWRALAVEGPTAPAPRAYHTLTRVEQRFLCVGGFDGTTTFGDAWWLVPSDDPLALRLQDAERRGLALQQAQASLAVSATAGLVPRVPLSTALAEEQHQMRLEALSILRSRIGLDPSPGAASEARGLPPPGEGELGEGPGRSRESETDAGIEGGWRPGDHAESAQQRRDQLQELGERLRSAAASSGAAEAVPGVHGDGSGGTPSGPDGNRTAPVAAAAPGVASGPVRAALRAVARHHLAHSDSDDLKVSDLDALFNDYRCQVALAHWRTLAQQSPGLAEQQGPAVKGSFYHLCTSQELRVSDVLTLQEEYRRLLIANNEPLQDPAAPSA